ncbi:hypothetical protein [Streptomyces laurentii]|uniref:hypothetical protein n=1 Tax=Streptomyces laurentii TaxID=39478 RepID=UPI003687540B
MPGAEPDFPGYRVAGAVAVAPGGTAAGDDGTAAVADGRAVAGRAVPVAPGAGAEGVAVPAPLPPRFPSLLPALAAASSRRLAAPCVVLAHKP